MGRAKVRGWECFDAQKIGYLIIIQLNLGRISIYTIFSKSHMQCTYIYGTGAKKGCQCSKNVRLSAAHDEIRCNLHKEKLLAKNRSRAIENYKHKITAETICEYVMKVGFRRGLTCGAPCIHKNDLGEYRCGRHRK